MGPITVPAFWLFIQISILVPVGRGSTEEKARPRFRAGPSPSAGLKNNGAETYGFGGLEGICREPPGSDENASKGFTLPARFCLNLANTLRLLVSGQSTGSASTNRDPEEKPPEPGGPVIVIFAISKEGMLTLNGLPWFAPLIRKVAGSEGSPAHRAKELPACRRRRTRCEKQRSS